MVRINDKLGFKPAGKRSMMNLPKDRAAAAALTAVQCPHCGRRGVREVELSARKARMCAWCGFVWSVEG